MTSWSTKKLALLCSQDKNKADDLTLPYLGLEDIESNTGRIIKADKNQKEEVISTTYAFHERHVLYGRLRPYLNKIATPTYSGRCSTEIIPLLPKAGVDRHFLAYALRRKEVADYVMQKNIGARMPRADLKILMSLEISCPPIDDQRRIASVLKRVESITHLRREQLAKTRALIPALFIDMFGNPATNPKGWEELTLGDCIESASYGTSKKASEKIEGTPVIRMGNVTYDGDTDLSNLKYIVLDDQEYEKTKLVRGDIIFNRTNSKELVGKTGLWESDMDAVAASYFIRIRVARGTLNPYYVWAFMNMPYMKKRLLETARGAIGQANINAKELQAFKIALPSMALQDLFEQKVKAIRVLETQEKAALQKQEALFQSLLHQAFQSNLDHSADQDQEDAA